MTALRKYPNVKARLRLSRKAPALPARESYIDIWLRGSRFRVCDEAGRSVSEILDDLASPRGLGATPVSMEGIMDVRSQSQIANAGPTELFGNHATGRGLAFHHGQKPWPMNPEELAPAAEQIFADGTQQRLESGEFEIRLGRRAKVYHGFLTGKIRGMRFKSEVKQVISPPYLLFCHVRDAANANYFCTRELISLEEKIVTAKDLNPPEKL